MKSRPLSVRVAAAEKAELEADEKKNIIGGDDDLDEEDRNARAARGDDVDEAMDVIGSMEGF